ncbi:hypothetical protein V6N13_137688 [Hibiscus sabdariffa]|uniref:STI1 domain-containing protein n=1 Tax=Hibiscus sabdariffa TaxID=183260 RepID=A0ABR2DJW5_9ROSI
MNSLKPGSIFLISAIFRVGLILYGEWQDAHMEVRYTDVDYIVFSDAASLMASGQSPYKRTTYRYSPLLAFLLIPNSFISPSWGKFLFSASDLFVGLFIRIILKQRKVPDRLCTYSMLIWLFNPFTFTIGTRGNCEPIVCAMILWIIICLINGSVFLLCTGFFFRLYGWEFLHEALLYHLTRTDPRHNFSIYFYHIYLNYERDLSVLEKLISFLPQFIVQLVLVFCFAKDLVFCFFVQTVAFVAFNKVITAQYFVWFFCLLPLILPWTNMKLKWKGLSCIFLWMGAQTHWLLWGYLLEFKGKNVFLQLWMAGLLFLAANTFILILLIRHHNYTPVFRQHTVFRKSGDERFASISSSSNQQTSSVGASPYPTVPPPSSQIGSPLFWIGVGVGLSALFTWVASSLKKYAMQQAFKTMMGQMNTQNNQFGNAAFPSGSPFPFPTPTSQGPVTSPSPPPQNRVTVDVPATKVEAAPVTDPATKGKSEAETAKPKKYAFVDVSPEESVQKSAFEDVVELSSSDNAQIHKDVSDNGAASKQDASAFGGYQSAGKAGPGLSVDALEKMMEDPTVQKMVYPYLPDEMRNPETFKWMLQNPQYRQQLQDMLNNMGGSSEWDNRMMDSLKNFDLNSPEVKQQFDQIGLTPEEVISKIMANPEVAMAFQNPRVQAAIMECSQNPLSIAKYQNDKEVMDVFNKISELFPGVNGSP